MTFPTMVYRSPGFHRGPKGATFDFLGVKDAAALKAAKAAGWHETMEEATGAKKVIEAAVALDEAIDEISPPTREELEAKAEELGVKFNARTKDAVLAKRIAEAIEAEAVKAEKAEA